MYVNQKLGRTLQKPKQMMSLDLERASMAQNTPSYYTWQTSTTQLEQEGDCGQRYNSGVLWIQYRLK